MRSKIGIIALSIAAAAAVPAFAVDGKTVMQNAKDVKKPAFTHSAVKMDLIEKDGTTETRMVEQWGKDEKGLVSTVMAFHTPASVKGTRFLQVENEGRDDDKWIYLPALRSVRRIASSEGSKSFMGTDATYDDMSGREVDQDTHETTGEEKVGDKDCWVVKSVPKDPADSQYSYRIACIDKASWVPVKVQMFDKKDKLIKVLVVEKLENVEGYWIPMQNLMTNVQTGHATRLTISKVEVDKPLDPKVFTTNFLSTGRL